MNDPRLKCPKRREITTMINMTIEEDNGSSVVFQNGAGWAGTLFPGALQFCSQAKMPRTRATAWETLEARFSECSSISVTLGAPCQLRGALQKETSGRL